MAGKDKQAQTEGLTEEYKRILASVDRVYDSSEYKERRTKMDRHMKEYKGEWWNNEMLNATDSKVFFNLFFADVETNAPLLTDNRPHWSATARRPMWQGYMEMLKLGADYQWDRLDMDALQYDVMKTSLIMPVGLQKVYYDPEEEDLCVENIDPQTFFIAPGYTDLWKAPWCGEKRPTDMLWVRTNYPDKMQYVKPDGASDKVDYTLYNDLQLSHEKVFVYEIWLKDDAVEEYIVKEQTTVKNEDGTTTPVINSEKRTKKKYPNGRVITLTRSVVLDDKPSPFSHGKAPYVPYYDYKNPDSFWGQGEADQLEDLARELNYRVQDLVTDAHAAGDKNYTVDIGSGLDPQVVKETFNKGYNFYGVNPGAVDPIRVINSGDPNRVHYELVNLLINTFQRVSGTTDISQGLVSKKQRQSAREIATLTESSYTRTRQRVRNYEWSLKRVFRLMLELMMQYYDEPRYVNFREQTPNGMSNSWAVIGNTAGVAREAVKPMMLPGESQEQYQQRLTEDQDYMAFLKWMDGRTDMDKVYATFDISIETNSSLPMDQQSRANLAMNLAQVQLTPNSPIDRKALLDTLRYPNAEEIDNRMMQKDQQAAAAQRPPQGAGQ